MRMIAITAALLIGSAAVAQTTTPPASDAGATPPAGEPMMAPSAGEPMQAPSAPMPPSGDPSMPSVPPAPGAPMDPAMPAPAGGQPTMGSMTPTPAPVAQAEYPRCSATVTDQCQQGATRSTKRRPRRG